MVTGLMTKAEKVAGLRAPFIQLFFPPRLFYFYFFNFYLVL